MDIRIPYLAEGVDSGSVVSILVKVGDAVKKEQTILELETNKATAPIPSPAAGTVSKILVKEGDTVSVGQAVMSLSESGTKEKPVSHAPEAKPAAVKSVSTPLKSSTQVDAPMQRRDGPSGAFPPPASPSVRKMARELGIDLTRVRGSERGGRITTDDLKAYIQHLEQNAGASAPNVSKPVSPVIDFSKWGPVKKQPVTPLRKKIAEKMQESWTRAPHVTQFDEADITSLMAFRKKYVPVYEKNGARLTLTGLILKAVVELLKQYPNFNSSLDEAAGELVLKDYYHLGVAVDTPAGLIVPVLKNVDQKNLMQISLELDLLAEKTRQRKISLEELQGGTFTISNLGGIGGTHFTPIVNLPEVAILGIGRGVLKPVVTGQTVEPRLMLPLALSYDHRVVDGADGARFMKDLVHALEHFEEKNFK